MESFCELGYLKVDVNCRVCRENRNLLNRSIVVIVAFCCSCIVVYISVYSLPYNNFRFSIMLMLGYIGPSSNPSIAYRVETFPGFGFLLRKAFYREFLTKKLPHCCNMR